MNTEYDPEELLLRLRPGMMILDEQTLIERPIKNLEMQAIISYCRTDILPRLNRFLRQVERLLQEIEEDQNGIDRTG